MRFYISLIIAKLAYLFLKITKLSSGTAIIGWLTLKICPDFLIYTNKFFERKINVTGTNGKTTTCGIISHLIKKDYKSIVNNSLGANMLTGIVNTLSVELNPFKKYDYSVIETDEGFLEKIYSKFKGDYLLVTNLFNDQLDRYGSITAVRDLIQKGVDKNPDVQLLLNADDPLVSSLKSNKESVFYGVENVIYSDEVNSFSTSENFTCPICGKELHYDKKFYSKQGHFSCRCGYKRCEPKYNAEITLYKNHSIIKINGVDYNVPVIGLYNAFNAVGAISLCLELGIQNIESNLQDFKVTFGRSELRELNGHETLIQLIKNPAGANEVIKGIDLDSNILIALNNNVSDGRDISWINDVHFSVLKSAKKEIVVSGMCSADIRSRLNREDITNVKEIPDIYEAVDYISKTADNSITILPSYTVLLKIDKMQNLRRK